VNRTFLLFGASLVVRFLLPAPWSAASLAFALAALVVSILAAISARRARAGGTVLAAALVMTLAASIGVLVGAVSLLLLPAEIEYQRCQTSAVTVSAEHACTAAYEEAVADLQERFTNPLPRPS